LSENRRRSKSLAAATGKATHNKIITEKGKIARFGVHFGEKRNDLYGET
jgi:hypothetical protein